MSDLRRFNRGLTRFALLGMPALGVLVSAVIAYGLYEEGSLSAAVPGAYLGAKLSFLSVTLALGMFQYKLFYDQLMEWSERVVEEDFGRGWSDARKKREALDRALLDIQRRRPQETDAAMEEENLKAELAALNKKFRGAYDNLAKSMNRLLVEYGTRLGMIFTIGFTLLASVLTDVLTLWFPGIAPSFFRDWSNVSLICAIAEFLILLMIFLYVVQDNIAEFGRRVDELDVKALIEAE